MGWSLYFGPFFCSFLVNCIEWCCMEVEPTIPLCYIFGDVGGGGHWSLLFLEYSKNWVCRDIACDFSTLLWTQWILIIIPIFMISSLEVLCGHRHHVPRRNVMESGVFFSYFTHLIECVETWPTFSLRSTFGDIGGGGHWSLLQIHFLYH